MVLIHSDLRTQHIPPDDGGACDFFVLDTILLELSLVFNCEQEFSTHPRLYKCLIVLALGLCGSFRIDARLKGHDKLLGLGSIIVTLKDKLIFDTDKLVKETLEISHELLGRLVKLSC